MRKTAFALALALILAAGFSNVALAGERIDSDNDGLEDDVEITIGTDPFDDDTDDDGVMDGTEVNVFGTDPLSADTDGDGLLDGTELGFVFPEGNDTHPPLFVPDSDPARPTRSILTRTATGSRTGRRTPTRTARWTPAKPTRTWLTPTVMGSATVTRSTSTARTRSILTAMVMT